MRTPTEKQIRLVEAMTKVLDIDFPTSSKEFTRDTFHFWIAAHIDEYHDYIDAVFYDEDYCYEFCQSDVWCEYY